MVGLKNWHWGVANWCRFGLCVNIGLGGIMGNGLELEDMGKEVEEIVGEVLSASNDSIEKIVSCWEEGFFKFSSDVNGEFGEAMLLMNNFQ